MSSIREVSRLDLSSALRLAKKLVYRQSDEELKKQQLLKEKLSAAKPVDSVPPQITPLLPRPYPKIIKADAKPLEAKPIRPLLEPVPVDPVKEDQVLEAKPALSIKI